MYCPSFIDLKFSQTSKDALKEINRKQELSQLLAKAVSYGSVINMFLGNDALKSSYSISGHDFMLMTQALQTIPHITRRVIEDIAGNTYLKVTNYDEKKFWKAVYSGCKI